MHPSLLALTAYRQFITYRVVPSATRPGKTDKFPCDYRTGQIANAHDPSIWTDYATAAASGSPVGFVFTEQDPFWFLDIDDCLEANGQWSPLAVELCGLFAGAAIERSQSGCGLHIFGTGQPPAHGCTNKGLGLEFYHAGRFVALTGADAVGNCATDCSAVLPALVARYFPPSAGGDAVEIEWTTEPDPDWNGPTDDGDLIRRAMMSRSTAAAFGGKAAFSDLWLANEQVLKGAYPDPARAYDCSAADAALAQHLAFWTGKNCERIRRLMLQSELVRDKWEREDYLPRTIRGAVARQLEVIQDKLPALAAALVIDGEPRATLTEGCRILGVEEQIELFKGCVYIQDQHKGLVPGGLLLKPEQFRVRYGGYSFPMDRENTKTSRDAWEAWTLSQCYSSPRVNGTCFRPDLKPGEIVERNGQTFVNTYFPVNVARKAGDPSPFLNHLAKVLPDERDRTILLSYMAACVQHQGIKFQWAPLLQGVQGNGKTLFTRCVAEAVGRRYVHWPKASKLAKEFNAWMVGKVFYAVEDIYVPDARREILEELKPMITGGDGLEIEAKGVDQVSTDICGNFMFNSNHKGAVIKTGDDRRFCMLFSAQQQFEDLAHDGMQGDYFPSLYEWLKADGYAIVSEFLWTYRIADELNPAAGCQRAPFTSTTDAAIEAGVGNIEQEIQEAIAQGLPGFAGGFVSSICLERLLEKLGLARKISHYRRKEILEGLGYIYHPALMDGRVNNPVIPDGGKPRLFVLKNSLLTQLKYGAEIAKAYEAANAVKVAFAIPQRA